jgi:hypothetical protein
MYILCVSLTNFSTLLLSRVHVVTMHMDDAECLLIPINTSCAGVPITPTVLASIGFSSRFTCPHGN